VLCQSCAATLPICMGDTAAQTGLAYTTCVSPLYFEGHVRNSLHRFKFSNARCYAVCYGEFLAASIAKHCKNRYDMLSWIPIHPRRHRKRGYDQAKILAEATAKQFGITAVETLRKIRHTDAQSGIKGHVARAANIENAYAVVDIQRIKGQRILLIDDIVTTGATLEEAADCLLNAGAAEVLCATVARNTKSTAEKREIKI